MITVWKILSRLPAGRWFFSQLVGWFVPYTGTIGASVDQLSPGQATVYLGDRRKVRNHLGSVHAIALANLGELTVGLATMALQPKNGRFIPRGIRIEYLKKARGLLRAETRLPYLDWADDANWEAECLIHNGSGEVVTRVVVEMKVGYL